jgi:hypothetical protein
VGLALPAILMLCCKKENTLSSTELLTGHEWRATSITRQFSDTGTIYEIFPGFDSCNRDDIYVFRPDSVFLRLEGPTRCAPGDPDVQSSTSWKLSPDGQTLNIGSLSNRILKLTGDSLVYQIKDYEPEKQIIRYARY